ncbi:protein FAM204A isoform X1 [Oryzias melastigma]|uniref:protein FAM204A isoform X1 n=1 Tax=Oryzias melastigma TaxID=30732 RepID=UPI000CF7E08B|nr:protein FAM204A isoform X1 [Oryzias melastigma]
MYSGLLPKGLTEEDLSPDDEAEEDDVRYPLQPPGCSAEISTAENPSAHGSRDPQTADMPGISQEMWQKFQDLRKKKNEVKTIRIREKRRKRRRKGAERQEPAGTREHEEEQQKHWNDLQQYFGVNDRFQPPPCSKPPPKSGLEKNIERAIAEGDFAKAEEMSDRLATRELAVKIAEAADCRDFVQRKQEEEASRAAQKRKEQIPWGFEAKKRWETKSNMGFM